MPIWGTVIALGLYVTLINVVAFLAFAWDKRCARNGQWRVPERSLLALAAIGGSVGSLIASRRLRHKTRKEPFRTNLMVIVIVHMAILTALSIPQVRDIVFQLLSEIAAQVKKELAESARYPGRY
jgi:uncharacterized membrane protein YsdA (DUF1294 family)